MPISKVGLNISGIDNLTLPDFNISSNVTQFVNDIPDRANRYTGNFVGTAIMIGLVFYLYYKLSDKSEVSSFRYSQIRSISIASGIVGIVGLVMINIGYFRQLYPVIFFIVIFMLSFIWTIKEER